MYYKKQYTFISFYLSIYLDSLFHNKTTDSGLFLIFLTTKTTLTRKTSFHQSFKVTTYSYVQSIIMLLHVWSQTNNVNVLIGLIYFQPHFGLLKKYQPTHKFSDKQKLVVIKKFS